MDRKQGWSNSERGHTSVLWDSSLSSVLRPNLFLQLISRLSQKQSSDPQHIHKRRKVKQRAHLSLPLIIQDIISEKKWKLSKMGWRNITPTLCSTFKKKVVYTLHMLITFPLTIYGCRLNRDKKISDDKKGKKHCQHPSKVGLTQVEKNTWEFPQCVTEGDKMWNT